MSECLFCSSSGPFSTVEHIIPESLGNDDLLLSNNVCDACQNYFGKEIEEYALSKTPFAFWRTFFGVKNKRKRLPSVDMSQPKQQKGAFPTTHPTHDNIGFTYHDDNSISIDIDDDSIVREILEGKKSEIQIVFTPKMLHMFGRFLCKVAVELICLIDTREARSEQFAAAIRYARFGTFDGLWPIFHYSQGEIHELKRLKTEGDQLVEEADIFSYSLINHKNKYILFHFSMGIDNWIISLNDPFPSPEIMQAFPSNKLDLIWYDKSEWQSAG